MAGDEACTEGDASIDSRNLESDAVSDGRVCIPELLFQRDAIFTNGQIYRVDLESFVEHPVSNGVDTDIYAEWSPDGTQVVLTRNAMSLWVVNADGSGPRQLDSSSAFLAYAKWSPDGDRIAYASIPGGNANGTIYSILAAGAGAPVNLSPGSDAQGPLEWSPDGSRILFSSLRTGNRDVFSMAANGTDQRNLTNRAGPDGDDGARWSPDGSKIVFVGQSKIWIMGADGSAPTNLSGTASGFFAEPTWSPDGSKIYYVENPENAARLFVMNANGANQHSIDSSEDIDVEPVPSPDGSRIAWSSGRDGNKEIYVSNIDGTNPVRVTNNSRPDTRPRWRPCPQ